MFEKIQLPLFLILFGSVYIACGCLSGFIFGQTITLNCTRSEPNQVQCSQQRRWAGLVPLGEDSIRNLQGAEVEDDCDEDGCMYRVLLKTTDGPAPLTSVYSSGLTPQEETAERINGFVQDREQNSLTVEDNSGLWGILFALIFSSVGLVIAGIGGFNAIRRQL
jgi:hypothetical protein